MSNTWANVSAVAAMTMTMTMMMMMTGCMDSQLPAATQTNDARSHDPWLDGGEACPKPQTQDESDGSAGGLDLPMEDITVGIGRVVEAGNTVRIHYYASLAASADGATPPKKIHDSRDDGPPIEIVINSTKTICGLDRALVGMHAGGQRRVHVPWRLAFGERGRPPEIKPRTDLVLVVDLFLPPDFNTHHSSGSPPPNPVRGGGGGGGGGAGRRR